MFGGVSMLVPRSLKPWCLLLLPFVGVACHARPIAPAPAPPAPTAAAEPARPPSPPPPAPRASAARPAPAAPTDAELFERKSLEELNAEHPLRDVFFDYDQHSLREDAKRTRQQDAQWLAKWRRTKIRIDGHGDERGTAEYNLAPGDRRVGEAGDYRARLGARSARVQMPSLGKESPFCHQVDEPCWSEKRRGHFVIVGKYTALASIDLCWRAAMNAARTCLMLAFACSMPVPVLGQEPKSSPL